jgi:hypothetical protein
VYYFCNFTDPGINSEIGEKNILKKSSLMAYNEWKHKYDLSIYCSQNYKT